MIQIAAAGSKPALTLRPWTEDDIPILVKAHADPEMQRWQLWHIDDEEQARAALAEQRRHWVMGTRFVFAVVADGNGDAPIGSVSIKRLAKEHDMAEFGYWTDARARGQSVATRAVGGVLAWAGNLWAEDPVLRYQLIHTLGNDASCRVAVKLGFALAEELPAHPPKFPEPGHLHVRRVADSD
jgi:RimJ/RimL family protein N-acetyltransferase